MDDLLGRWAPGGVEIAGFVDWSCGDPEATALLSDTATEHTRRIIAGLSGGVKDMVDETRTLAMCERRVHSFKLTIYAKMEGIKGCLTLRTKSWGCIFWGSIFPGSWYNRAGHS